MDYKTVQRSKTCFDQPQSVDNMAEENFNQSVWKKTSSCGSELLRSWLQLLEELNLQSRRLIMTHSLVCSVTHSHVLHMLWGYPEKGASAGCWNLWNLWKDWVKNTKGLADVNHLDVTKYDYLTWNRNKVKKNLINKAQKCACKYYFLIPSLFSWSFLLISDCFESAS